MLTHKYIFTFTHITRINIVLLRIYTQQLYKQSKQFAVCKQQIVVYVDYLMVHTIKKNKQKKHNLITKS